MNIFSRWLTFLVCTCGFGTARHTGGPTVKITAIADAIQEYIDDEVMHKVQDTVEKVMAARIQEAVQDALILPTADGAMASRLTQLQTTVASLETKYVQLYRKLEEKTQCDPCSNIAQINMTVESQGSALTNISQQINVIAAKQGQHEIAIQQLKLQTSRSLEDVRQNMSLMMDRVSNIENCSCLQAGSTVLTGQTDVTSLQSVQNHHEKRINTVEAKQQTQEASMNTLLEIVGEVMTTNRQLKAREEERKIEIMQLKASQEKNKLQILAMEKLMNDLRTELLFNYTTIDINSDNITKLNNKLSSIDNATREIERNMLQFQNDQDMLDSRVNNVQNTSRIMRNHFLTLHNNVTTLKSVIGILEKGLNATRVAVKKNHPPADCTEFFSQGHTQTGVYRIQPRGSAPYEAYCDMRTGGWTVLMRRYDGSQDFYLYWSDYKTGFGNPAREHWLGNDRMHFLTNAKNYTLRVEFTIWSSGQTGWAEYTTFRVEGESNRYKLHVGGYTGSHVDRLSYHNGMMFSTRDRDNDRASQSCAQSYKGGNWYKNCHLSNPTGLYKSSGLDSMWWNPHSTKAMTLKIRPA